MVIKVTNFRRQSAANVVSLSLFSDNYFLLKSNI